MREKVKQYL